MEFSDQLSELGGTREPKRLFEKISASKDDLKKLSDTCKELSEFVTQHFVNYQVMQKFVRDNDQNFSSLEEADRAKAVTLAEYFNTPDNPSAKFPLMRKIYSELLKSIDELVKSLSKKVVDKYLSIYDEVDEQAKIAAADGKGLFTSRQDKIEQFKGEKNISNLRLALEHAPSFKAECLQAISTSTGKETIIIKLHDLGSLSQIETEDQIEEFIKTVRTRLMKELKSGKTIIIK